VLMSSHMIEVWGELEFELLAQEMGFLHGT
jgi:hypothetical protein